MSLSTLSKNNEDNRKNTVLIHCYCFRKIALTVTISRRYLHKEVPISDTIFLNNVNNLSVTIEFRIRMLNFLINVFFWRVSGRGCAGAGSSAQADVRGTTAGRSTVALSECCTQLDCSLSMLLWRFWGKTAGVFWGKTNSFYRIRKRMQLLLLCFGKKYVLGCFRFDHHQFWDFPYDSEVGTKFLQKLSLVSAFDKGVKFYYVKIYLTKEEIVFI